MSNKVNKDSFIVFTAFMKSILWELYEKYGVLIISTKLEIEKIFRKVL